MAKVKLLELAMHTVFEQPASGRAEPDIATGLTPLEPESATFIEKKLEEALEDSGEIVRMKKPPTPVPELLDNYILDKCDLLTFSSLAAVQLQQVQTRITPSGLLLVARVFHGDQESVLLAKMEHDVGVRAPLAHNSLGKRYHSLEIIRDLFMTSKTKVFKVGLFDYSFPENGHGRLRDNQAQEQDGALYFLHGFLGCEYTRRPEIITRDFYSAVAKSLKGTPVTERAGSFVALVQELTSNSKTIDAATFASSHLDESARQRFNHLRAAEGIPRRFIKNLSLIENELNSVEIRYDTGTILYTLPDQIDSTVVINGDQTTVSGSVQGFTPSTKRLKPSQLFPEVSPRQNEPPGSSGS